jgi:sulfotransferase
MNKTYHFLAGLPRSGNTLLSAIFNQNPEIYSTPLSPLPALMWDLKTSNHVQHTKRNKENQDRSHKTLCSLFDTFYSDVDKPVIIDREKSWGTPANLSMIKEYVTKTPKIIFTVRDILEIISSYIFLNEETNYLTNELVDSDMFITNYRSQKDLLAEHIMRQGSEMDKSLLSLASAFYPENKGIFHIVEYNDLVLKPQETMTGIYKFLGIPNYEHNFNKIEKVELDNDAALGLPKNLHDIKKSISKSSTSTDILSDYIKHKYSNMEFWREGSLMKIRGKDF